MKLLLFNLIHFVFGCTPLVVHDQSRYCGADYAFSGIVRFSRITASESVFQIQVIRNIKGRVTFPNGLITVYGRGTLNSCGATRLNLDQRYILYVLSYDNRLSVYQQQEVSAINFNRIRRYDCSCEIEINLPQQPFDNSMIPARDKCIITEREWDCTFQNGYCSRAGRRYGPRGACQWVPGISNC
ncbi:uncharacterized protein LOC133187649 [Saccostrea echinata]|uniref:uncharacterized protein LOC133187649 n=1 Tax=Saccostrea echinata TaxID=191078 RepID=UPI002A83483B|nr:uncharacterized protein LOC133187649 [Saccostrea echinata]